MKTNSVQKKILVIGSGGVGGYFGGRLAQAGHHVVFIARGNHLRVLRTSGLRVKSVRGSFRKKIFAQKTLPKKMGFDLILLCLKAHQRPALLRGLHHRLAPTGVAISLQNGLDNSAALQTLIPPEKIIPGFCVLGSYVESPGVIRHLAAGQITLGRHPQAKSMAQLFVSAGIPTKISKIFRKAQWQKFIWNIGFNGPTAMMDLSVGDLLKRAEYRQWVELLMREALAVAKKDGVVLANTLPRKMVAFSKAHLASVLTSMAIDRRRKRPLEVDIFYGALCTMAKKQRVSVPHAHMVKELLGQISRSALI